MVLVPAETFGTTDWTATPALVCTVASPTLAEAIPPGTETIAVVLPARIFTLPLRCAGGHCTDRRHPSDLRAPVATNPHAVMSRGKLTWYWPVFSNVLAVPGQPARARVPSEFTTAYKARHKDAEVTLCGAWTTGPGGCGLPWLVAAAMPVPASVSTVATPAPSKMWPALDRRMCPPAPNNCARIISASASHHVTGWCDSDARCESDHRNLALLLLMRGTPAPGRLAD